jgi:endonuclease-8
VPEGDLVWRTARTLDAALAGDALTGCDLRWPTFATTDLTGRTVLAVVSRGKHLLMRLDGDPPLTLHSHLRMEGSWRLYPAGQDAPTGASRRDDVRAVLRTSGWTAVGRRLGMLDVVRTQDEDRVVGHLGPDVLGEDWDPDLVERTLSRFSEQAIGEALLDQRVLAGVGTFYLAEVLFLRGVNPWTPAAQVRDVAALLRLVHRLMVANSGRVGQVTTGDTRPGRTSWVYGRAGRPCRRCGTPVAAASIGERPQERVVFFCPSCQPAHTAEAARS